MITLLLPNVLGIQWWSMVSIRTGEAGGGLDILALGGDGRIRTDQQFIGAN